MKKYEIDMCRGPLTGKIILFAIPVILTGILQLLYNAADIVVVGQFAGKEALAAVGSTGALTNLIINIFIGLSIGTSVVVSNYYGAGNREGISDAVHTSIAIAVLSGAFLAIVGFFAARPMLLLMGTPEDVIDGAVLYMQIFFLGMPFNMVYNFGGGILRAVGDTRRPLYFLTISGIVNVVLNLVFVIGFKMSVAGVALATIISQLISAILIVRCLILTDSVIKLHIKQLKIHKHTLFMIMRIGLPAGIQGSLFSISNVLIQSSVNSFGSVVVAGNSAASNLEGFVYTAMNAVYQTAVTFTSQNMGAKQYKRTRRVLHICLIFVTLIGVVMGGAFYLLRNVLLRIYNNDAEVIAKGAVRMLYLCAPYFLCGIMDVMVGQLRGMGYSIMSMLISLSGACLMRIVWIYTAFRAIPTLDVLYLSYPVSWGLTFIIQYVCYLIVRRKYPKKDEELVVQT